ncbi:MAG: hypothetical protein ACD_4C00459G0001 [uncultured bacterium (gcode 4)]|uniref:Uncharacterized protein n=1 Tax=uncultured bacterium (gcode 4) TaxID=1234023 RepID=K2FVZ0_9BACT|nr:MAG: hypothetical protein ACD_4C00459G0001 [uncultured bacterium (gcode 4)]
MTQEINQETQSNSVKEIEICKNYNEVLQSKYFDDFLKVVIEEFAEGYIFQTNTNPDNAFDYIVIGINEIYLRENLKKVLIEFFNEVRSGKFITNERLQILKKLEKDEKFIDIAKKHYENIWTYKWENREGIMNFMKMFSKDWKIESGTDFSYFFHFLWNKIIENNVEEFWKNISKILDKDPIAVELYKDCEIVSEWNKLVLLSYDKGSNNKIFFLCNKVKQEKIEKYEVIIGDLNIKEHLPSNVITAKNTETWKMVFLDLDNMEEIISYDKKYWFHVEFNGKLYFYLIQWNNAIVYDFSWWEVINIFENSKFEFADYRNEFVCIKTKWEEEYKINLYSLKDNKIILDNFSYLKNKSTNDRTCFVYAFYNLDRSNPIYKVFIDWIWSVNQEFKYIDEDSQISFGNNGEIKVRWWIEWKESDKEYIINIKNWEIISPKDSENFKPKNITLFQKLRKLLS